MTQSLAQFAVRARNLGPELRSNLKRGINAAALHTKRSVEAEMTAAGVGGKRLSGVGIRGARIGVRYDVRGSADPVAVVRATGPFHLVERSTKPHAITPKRRARRGQRKRAVVIPGVGPRASAQHPGTRGKAVFAKGVERARPGVRRIIGESVMKTIRG